MREEELHPTPEWSGILKREFRGIVFSGRTIRLLALFVGPLAVATLIASISSWVSGSAVVYAFLGVAGALWPAALWRKENWGSRDYRWSLPVGPAPHDLARVVLGWLVLLGASLVIIGAALLIDLQNGHAERVFFLSRPSFWMGALLLPTVMYFVVSAAWLSARQPWVWLSVPYVLSMVIRSAVDPTGDLPPVMSRVLDPLAIFVTAPVSRIVPDTWIWADLYAVTLAVLCMLIALRRYMGISR